MKYTPQEVKDTIYDIDFDKLYHKGFTTIISDLDNTLMKYTEDLPDSKLENFIKDLKNMGFKIYLISNNKNKRLKRVSDILLLDGYLEKSGKPNNKKIIRYALDKNIDLSKTIGIGDQLVTDILGFNRSHMYSILVKTIDKKTQKWYTKINRLREKRIIKKMIKENKQIGEEVKRICQDA